MPDEHVEDSDDEFYDWEFQAYARVSDELEINTLDSSRAERR